MMTGLRCRSRRTKAVKSTSHRSVLYSSRLRPSPEQQKSWIAGSIGKSNLKGIQQ